MTTDSAAVVKHEQQADAPPSIIVADRPPTALLPSRGDLEAMALIAGQAVKATGMIPASVKTKEQALAILLAGWELGLRPMTALRHCYVVNGKTEIETRAMVGIIRARDPRIQFEWPEYTREAVTCVLSRPGQPVTKVRYTVEDAKASGQYKEGVWSKYTRDMLYAAATKRACRLACPDLINAIEGAMQTEAEAVSLTMPDAQVRVLDQSEPHEAEEQAAGIPATAYNEGDEGALSVEVEVPSTESIQQTILDDIKRAHAEFGDGFADWANKLRIDFPDAFDAKGRPQFPKLDADALTALAERVRRDVGAPPEQGALIDA